MSSPFTDVSSPSPQEDTSACWDLRERPGYRYPPDGGCTL